MSKQKRGRRSYVSLGTPRAISISALKPLVVGSAVFLGEKKVPTVVSSLTNLAREPGYSTYHGECNLERDEKFNPGEPSRDDGRAVGPEPRVLAPVVREAAASLDDELDMIGFRGTALTVKAKAMRIWLFTSPLHIPSIVDSGFPHKERKIECTGAKNLSKKYFCTSATGISTSTVLGCVRPGTWKLNTTASDGGDADERPTQMPIATHGSDVPETELSRTFDSSPLGTTNPTSIINALIGPWGD
ncbi:hypothetical protein ACG7TL_002672 [Trametes sanguinea]